MRLYTIHSSDGVSALAPYPRKLQCSTRGAELAAEMKKSEEQDWIVTPSSGNSSIQIPLAHPRYSRFVPAAPSWSTNQRPISCDPRQSLYVYIYIHIHQLPPFCAPKTAHRSDILFSWSPNVKTHLMTSIEADLGTDDDPRLAIFKELYVKSESWKDFLKRVNLRQTLEHSDRKSCADIRSPRIRHQCCAVLP